MKCWRQKNIFNRKIDGVKKSIGSNSIDFDNFQIVEPVPDNLPPILSRLGIEQQGWLDTINHYEQRFFRAVGAMDKIRQFADRLGQCWLKG